MKCCGRCKYFDTEGSDMYGKGFCGVFTILPEPIKKGLLGIFKIEIDEYDGEDCMLFDER